MCNASYTFKPLETSKSTSGVGYTLDAVLACSQGTLCGLGWGEEEGKRKGGERQREDLIFPSY